MSTLFILMLLSLGVIGCLMLAFVFVVGIVWRTEMELDWAFKCFAVAVLFFLVSEVMTLFPSLCVGSCDVSWQVFILPLMKLAASLNLLLGLFFMRDLIRRLDGEKETSMDIEKKI